MSRRSIRIALAALVAGAFQSLAPAQTTVGDLPITSQHSKMAMPMPALGSVSMPAAPSHPAPPYQAASTRKMAALLAQIYAATDWRLDPTKPAQRVGYYKQMLAKQTLSPPDAAVVTLQLAKEQLYAGDSEVSIQTLEGLRAAWAKRGQALPPDFARQVGEWLAMSYLRLGEQQNCAGMHGPRACIFPIQAAAAHQLPRGAQGAVRELTALLAANPQDARSRWLLNVAYMQLGKYPSEVPSRYLVPANLFRSDEPDGSHMPQFPDTASSAGLDILSHAGGALVEDFDGDGLLDIMVSSSGPADQMHLFHNNGNGTFSDITRAAGLEGETGGLNLVLTDYNNDGHPDVLVLRGGWWGKQGCYPFSLLKNNGNGTFDDVTEAAGLLSLAPTQTAAWADYDNDGRLDLFVGHESKKDDPHPSQLFHNNGDGTFTEVGAAGGLPDLGFVKGVAWGDYNNDGRPDLYISVMYGHNRLLRNDGPADARASSASLDASPDHKRADQETNVILSEGRAPGERSYSPGWQAKDPPLTPPASKPTPWRFTDVTAAAGVAQQSNSFATWFFDYDNDGWPDIFVAGYSVAGPNDLANFETGGSFHADLPRLYRNNHDGTFTDQSRAAHLDRAILPMGANFGDLDNDGWLDIYLGTGDSEYTSLLPNRMFRNREGRSFADVTTAGGFGNLQKGHAIAFADIEGTGFEDVFEEMGGALPGDTYQSSLYHNPGNTNHWITLMLEGVETNRAAFGARIELELSTPSGPRRIYRTVGYGSSFGGNPFRQHIGLGAATRAEKITVTWHTSHTTQSFLRLAADAAYRLREGDKVQRVSTQRLVVSR